MTTIVRRPAGANCASILAELPEWFGMTQANLAYARAAESDLCWVAGEGGEAHALMVLEDTGFAAIDIHLLAVRPHLHRQGLGRALVREARAFAFSRSKHFLTVKTQGPSAQYEHYDRTRTFYEALGFSGLEEFTEIWGPENPCLFMAMSVQEVR